MYAIIATGGKPVSYTHLDAGSVRRECCTVRHGSGT